MRTGVRSASLLAQRRRAGAVGAAWSVQAVTAIGYGNERAKSIYDGLPVFLQNVVSSGYGLRQRAQIHGAFYRSYLRQLQESQWLGESEVLAQRDAKVAEFMRRADRDSPFWHETFHQAGLRASDLGVESLTALPIMSKETARLEMDRITTRPWVTGTRKGVAAHTSGTTGMALHLTLSQECFQREYAFRDLHRSWGGIRPGDRTATIAGHPVVPTEHMDPPFWRHNAAFNQTIFSSIHLTESTLPLYVRELKRLAPKLIHGYPSSLYIVALSCLESGEEGIRPQSVFCHSETLLDRQRESIERAFGCKAFNWYGNTEMTVNIVECESGRLHVKNEHSLVEFLRVDGTPAEPGEYARIITTGFGNDATPLIRYDTGDVAVLSSDRCDCGRPGPLVAEVLGRHEDIFVTPDGRLVGRLDHVFKDALNVVEAQLFQPDVDTVIVRVVRRAGYGPADEAMILRELRLRLGQAIVLTFEYVDQIPRTSNGKFRFAVSLVPLPLG